MLVVCSRGVVDLHGGSLRLFTDSTADKGADAEAAAAAAEGESGGPASVPAGAGGTRERKTFVLEIPMVVGPGRAAAPTTAADELSATPTPTSTTTPVADDALTRRSMRGSLTDSPTTGLLALAGTQLAITALLSLPQSQPQSQSHSRPPSRPQSPPQSPCESRTGGASIGASSQVSGCRTYRTPAVVVRISLTESMLFVAAVPVVVCQLDPLSGIAAGGQGSGVAAPARHKRVSTLAGVVEGTPRECNEAADGQSLRQSARQSLKQAGEQGPDHSPDQDQGQGQGAGRPLVLVVDDSDLTRKMLCRMMRVHGYDCEEAEDGVQAVERVRRNLARSAGRQYAVVLMDFVVRDEEQQLSKRQVICDACILIAPHFTSHLLTSITSRTKPTPSHTTRLSLPSPPHL